jgi:hypothetical protein
VSRRNLAWLVVVVGAGVLVGVTTGWIWGVLAAVVVLVISEAVERTLRKRRRAARGITEAPKLRDAISSRRRAR